MQKKILLILNILIIVGLAALGFYQSQRLEKHNNFKRCSDQYPLINPNIDCGKIDENISQIREINTQIEDFINLEKQTGKAAEISVFFRDLNTKQWFGVNENTNFYPASLVKLPTAMMFYEVAEIDKEILNISETISQKDADLNTGQHYPPSETLTVGQTYTIAELIRRTLVYSDNAPVKILANRSALFANPVFLDLGIIFPPKEGESMGQWNITAKTFSSLFRVLYNTSYIRPQYSNIILEDLATSNFKKGLAAGIPEETRIAHKYGEASQTDEDTKKVYTVLNDCGIIYKENNPYILCVMTQGENFESLETIIKIISEKVYQSL